MFGKKKNSAPLKNQARDQKDHKQEKRMSFFPKFKVRRNEKAKKSSKSNSIINRIFKKILGDQFLSQEWVVKNAPLILLIFGLIILAIGNNYIAQRKSIRITKVKREIKDLRDEYISTKSQLMYSTKMSEIAKKLESRGIKEPVKPAFKLIISEKEDEK